MSVDNLAMDALARAHGAASFESADHPTLTRIDDDEELQGGEEIAARDRHRWELDPGSSDDFEER